MSLGQRAIADDGDRRLGVSVCAPAGRVTKAASVAACRQDDSHGFRRCEPAWQGDAFFVAAGVPEAARETAHGGPWDAGLQHAGLQSALLARAVERCEALRERP